MGGVEPRRVRRPHLRGHPLPDLRQQSNLVQGIHAGSLGKSASDLRFHFSTREILPGAKRAHIGIYRLGSAVQLDGKAVRVSRVAYSGEREVFYVVSERHTRTEPACCTRMQNRPGRWRALACGRRFEVCSTRRECCVVSTIAYSSFDEQRRWWRGRRGCQILEAPCLTRSGAKRPAAPARR